MAKKIGKFLLLGIAILFTLWITALAVIYFTVDINEVKQYAVDFVNENTKGELRLGKVSLKLFPTLHFEFNELKVLASPAYRKMEVIGCDKVLLKFNFISLIMGKPKLTVVFKEPALNFIKRGSSNNMSDLVSVEGGSSEQPVKIPPYLLLASYVFELRKGYFNINNDGKIIKIKGMDLRTEFDPVTRNINGRIVLPVIIDDGQMHAEGDIYSTVDVKLVDINNRTLAVNAAVDAEDVYFKSGNLVKKSGVALKIDASVSAGKNNAEIKNLTLVLADKFITLSGKVKQLSSDVPKLDVNIASEPYSLSNIGKFMSIGKMPDGTLSVSGSVYGPVKPLPYLDLKLKYEGREPEGIVNISVVKKSPKTVLKVDSAKIDVSSFIPESSESSGSAEEEKSVGKKTAANDPAQEADLIEPELVSSLKSLLSDYPLKLDVDIKEVMARQITAKDVYVNLDANSGRISFSKIALAMLDGKINSSLVFKLVPANPVLAGNAGLSGLEFRTLVNTFMPELKDSVSGQFSADLKFSASGTKKSKLMKSLTANGSFSVKKFLCDTASLNDLLKPHLEKVSFLKNKVKLSGTRGWDKIEGSFAIRDQVINLKKFDAEDADYRALGKGTIDFNLRSDLYIDLNLPYSNVPYEALRVNERQSMLPVHLTGPVAAPKVDFGYTLKHITKKSVSYETSKLTKKLKQKVSKQAAQKKIEQKKQEVKQEVKQKANEQLKKAGEALKNKFKGFRF